MPSLAAQRARIRHLQGRLEQVPASRPALDALARDRRLGGNLLAGALAFRLFAVLLPLALLTAVGLGYAATVDDHAAAEAGKAVGIREATLSSIAQSSRLEAQARWLVLAFAVFGSVYAAVKAARAVHAVYGLAWTAEVGRAAHPLRAGLMLLATVGGVLVVWGAVGRLHAELGAGGVAISMLAVVVYAGLWLAVSLLLPHGDAPWRALVPGAVLVGVGMQVIHLGTVLIVSHQLERASATYGPLGAAFTILVWLFVISRVVVGSAMLNAVLWHRGAPPRPEGHRVTVDTTTGR